jgi:endoglucanase
MGASKSIWSKVGWICALLVGLTASGASAADRTEALLKALSEAPGPSGFEEPVRAIVVRELKPLATTITYDGMGSVIAQNGTSGPRIMLDAHMDELGGMVRRITPDGFVTIQMLGGWLDMALPGQRWVILTAKGPVKAVSGIRDIHVTPADERTKPFNRDNLYLDVGAKSAADAAALGIEPGDAVAPDVSFEELANGRYLGKAWDDRVGCAVVIEALRRLAAEGHPNTLFVAATTQEEIGLRGAKTAAAAIHPDIGLVIEGGMAGDQPGDRPDETNSRLGGGPDIFLYDASSLPNLKLVAFLKAVAQDIKVPVQSDLVTGYGDDSAEIQKSGTGVPTVNIGVPVRYMHVHNGVMDRADFDATVNLVVATIKRLNSAEVSKIKDFAP